MKAVDTNVLARYVVADDLPQSASAAAILSAPCFVSLTVLLETAWLLSSRYGLDRADLAQTLSDLTTLPSVTFPDRGLVRWAIERFADGADLADMLHLVSSARVDGFATFDRRLARQAGPGSPVPVELIA